MSFTTPLQSDDNGADSRDKINDNFTAVENEIDTLVVAGAPLATDSVKGRVKLSVAPVDAAEPTAVGDNDPVFAMLTDAVSTPSTPQTDDDGKLVKLNANGQIPGDFIKNKEIEYFTSGGTWTKPAGLQYVEVEVQGAGGNGAGGSSGAFAGGGSGAYTRKKILASALGATETVTIGGIGSATSFGSHLSCNSGTSASTITPGEGGTVATAGDFSVAGVNGIGGFTDSVSSRRNGGNGASSFLGNGGAGGSSGSGSTQFELGHPGTGYGSGGGGASAGTTSRAGGSGTPGIVIVHEYF
jgi:hypothetical protein